MSAAQFFKAFQQGRANKIQDELNRKQEEYYMANMRMQESGVALGDSIQDIIRNQDLLKQEYAGDTKYLNQLDRVVRGGQGFYQDLDVDFYNKTFNPDIMGYDFAEFLNKTSAAQVLSGNANINIINATPGEDGNMALDLINNAGGRDGGSKVLTTITEGGKQFEFGGVPYKLSNGATGFYLNNYLQKLGQLTNVSSFGDNAAAIEAFTGVKQTNIGMLSGTGAGVDNPGGTPLDKLTPGPLLSDVMSGKRTYQSLTIDEIAAITEDPYLVELIDGQQMESIEDLGSIKSFANQGLYSNINRQIIEAAFKDYEGGNRPDALPGEKNNNPLNIRYVEGNKWLGRSAKHDDINGFEKFEHAAYGIRNADELLKTYGSKYRDDSVRDVVSRWSPPKGKYDGKEYTNNTESYINEVARQLGISPDDKIDLANDDTRRDLIKAMVTFETPGLTITDDMIAGARDISEVAANALTTTKTAQDGVGYSVTHRGKTYKENTLPFMSFYDDEAGKFLEGDELFNAVMSGFRPQNQTANQLVPSGGYTVEDASEFVEGAAETGDSGLLGSEDALIINRREELKSYFYREGSIPFDLTSDQFNTLNPKQKNLLFNKARQVTNSNTNRIRNSIKDAAPEFSSQDEDFYLKFFSNKGLGFAGERVRRRNLGRRAPDPDNIFSQKSLEDFFADNPEYGREFFQIGPKRFAEKYDNDLGFMKNFPSAEDVKLENERIKNMRYGAREELAKILINRTDKNIEKANFTRLPDQQRLQLITHLYMSGAGGKTPLITTEHFNSAMDSFMETGVIDLNYATTGQSKKGTVKKNTVDLTNIGGAIQPIIDNFYGLKRDGETLGKSKRFSSDSDLIFDANAAAKSLPGETFDSTSDIGKLMAFKEQHANDPRMVNLLNDVLEDYQIQRLVGYADFFNLFGGDRPLTPDQFQDSTMYNVPPQISVELEYLGETFYPISSSQANLYLRNGAELKGYQFYGDDNKAAGKFVDAADLNSEFDKRSVISMLGLGTNDNGGLSRTARLQLQRQQGEDPYSYGPLGRRTGPRVMGSSE